MATPILLFCFFFALLLGGRSISLGHPPGKRVSGRRVRPPPAALDGEPGGEYLPRIEGDPGREEGGRASVEEWADVAVEEEEGGRVVFTTSPAAGPGPSRGGSGPAAVPPTPAIVTVCGCGGAAVTADGPR